jgi:hypothetical protein
LKEAKEMWKNPPSIEKARERVARIKEDMKNDNIIRGAKKPS